MGIVLKLKISVETKYSLGSLGYKLWTAKESIIKLIGKGFVIDLRIIMPNLIKISIVDRVNNPKFNLTLILFYRYLNN